MEWFLRDLKYGARSLLRDKGFASTAMLTLAVCIAINSAIYAIVNSVLLRPLPVPQADAILLMSNQYPKAGVPDTHNSSAGDYYDRLREVSIFSEQAMFQFNDRTLTINNTAQRVSAMSVTPSLFQLLRTHPLFGRTFADDEGEIGAEQKVILSHGLWRELFGGDRSAVGQNLRIDGKPYTIIGVLPPGFNFIRPEVRLWVPLAFTAEQKTTHHSNNWYNVGRLKPGATLQQAQDQINALNAANLGRFPQVRELLINAGFRTQVSPLQEMLVRDIKPVLYLLWAGAIFVLLIGVLNITNLALARFELRRAEFATRLALGASRTHLFRQVITECGLLAILIGIAGLTLGWLLLRALAFFGLERFPRADEVRMGPEVFLIILALAAIAGFLISLAPLSSIFRGRLQGSLLEQSRSGTTGRRTRRLRQGLVVVQVGWPSPCSPAQDFCSPASVSS